MCIQVGGLQNLCSWPPRQGWGVPGQWPIEFHLWILNSLHIRKDSRICLGCQPWNPARKEPILPSGPCCSRLLLWMTNVSCHSVNKGFCSQPASSHCSGSQLAHPEGIQDGEKQDTGPRWPRGLWKEWFQQAQTLATSPYTEKVLNSLTWEVWFPLINSNFLMFRSPGFYCQTSVPWLLLYCFEAVPQSDLRGCISDFSLRKIHWIKHNSPLLDCAF